MNALEWNGNHETSSLHKEEVVLQACQIKEWHHIIFVNADSSSSIIRQTWKVLFLYHMVRQHFPFMRGVSGACLSRSPASSTAGNLQKLRKKMWQKEQPSLLSGWSIQDAHSKATSYLFRSQTRGNWNPVLAQKRVSRAITLNPKLTSNKFCNLGV